jgi:chromosome segregation ATPase
MMEVKCSKEKEIAEMAVKIDNIEKNVGEIKQTQKETLTEIRELFQTVSTTYATKEELKTEITRLEASRNFLADNWDKIIYMIALAVIGLLYLKDKI